MSETLDLNQETGKRPVFLTVLCILSFIAAGFGIIGMLFMGAARGVADSAGINVQEKISENPYMDAASTDALEAAQAVFSWPYIIAALVLILIGLFGVIKMWKLQKVGFFIYVGTQVAGIILPLLFGIAFSVGGVIMPVVFIVLYGLNLKHLK